MLNLKHWKNELFCVITNLLFLYDKKIKKNNRTLKFSILNQYYQYKLLVYYNITDENVY